MTVIESSKQHFIARAVFAHNNLKTRYNFLTRQFIEFGEYLSRFEERGHWYWFADGDPQLHNRWLESAAIIGIHFGVWLRGNRWQINTASGIKSFNEWLRAQSDFGYSDARLAMQAYRKFEVELIDLVKPTEIYNIAPSKLKTVIPQLNKLKARTKKHRTHDGYLTVPDYEKQVSTLLSQAQEVSETELKKSNPSDTLFRSWSGSLGELFPDDPDLEKRIIKRLGWPDGTRLSGKFTGRFTK